MFLTLPIWGGLAMFAISSYSSIKEREGNLVEALKGKQWLM